MIAIIDYGAGNTASLANTLEELDYKFILTNNIDELNKADKVILPGVGEASFAFNTLKKYKLVNAIKEMKQPFLGICLGMQLLASFSPEGNTKCFGIVETDIKKFDNKLSPVPHMGWNKINIVKENKLFTGMKNGEYFYFAHSYYMPVVEDTIASCENVINFTAALKKDNFYGVQFHPEKSSAAGLTLLKNFIELC